MIEKSEIYGTRLLVVDSLMAAGALFHIPVVVARNTMDLEL
jgi:hypothetical protein